jgi:prepilin-type N-terminal cleavage/methylation domain-containing protein
MRTCDGLTLTEVLVSLVIVTSVSLALLNQQSYINQFTEQISHRGESLVLSDNTSELLWVSPGNKERSAYEKSGI